MITLNTIWIFIKKYYQILIFGIAILLSIALFQTCNTLKTERAQREFEKKQDAQNLSAFKDSLTTIFDKKLNAYITEKDNYVVNELKDLKEYNKMLYDKIEKVKGDVIGAIDSKVTGDLGGITAGNQLVVIDPKTNNYGLKFKSDYSDKGFEQYIEGISKFYVFPDEKTKKWTIKPDSTEFTTNLTKVNITYGFRDLKDKYEVFAVSSSPKIKINELNGVLVLDKIPEKKPEKPKKFGFGPYFGAGMNTDFNGTNARFGWSAGVSLHYDLFSWRWGKK